MPYIRQVEDDEATGDCKRALDASRARAGRVWNIVRIMTPNPAVLQASKPAVPLPSVDTSKLGASIKPEGQITRPAGA